ncbi:hypothetical protein [Desulfotignum phosphitoxidans]|uniref:hypothetical protein n=1 Tax=Desulfotignum phosphitoxidans TaxID=190898 RepID=UPI000586FE19|nr:hypothetical protein [Desulfotignum phosphitoxidans]
MEKPEDGIDNGLLSAFWSGKMSINVFSVQCFFQNNSISFHPQSYPVLSKPNFKTQGIAFHLFYHPKLMERFCSRKCFKNELFDFYSLWSWNQRQFF